MFNGCHPKAQYRPANQHHPQTTGHVDTAPTLQLKVFKTQPNTTIDPHITAQSDLQQPDETYESEETNAHSFC